VKGSERSGFPGFVHKGGEPQNQEYRQPLEIDKGKEEFLFLSF
jgi:hypothetical protein